MARGRKPSPALVGTGMARTTYGLPQWGPRFLRRYLEFEGDVEAAAVAVNVSLIAIYEAEDTDEAFRAGLEKVRALIERVRGDRIEFATSQRAIKGTPYVRTLPDGSVETGSTPDTRAAALMLGGIRPKKFREKAEPTAGEEIRTVTQMFRALADAARATGAASPAPRLEAADPDVPTAEVIEPEEKPEPLIRRIVN